MNVGLPVYATWPERIWHVALRVLCVSVLLFLLAPLAAIIPLSFTADSFLMYPIKAFSLRWYAEFFGSAEWQNAIKNTLIITPAATLIATVLGTLASIGLTNTRLPAHQLINGMLIAPMGATTNRGSR